MKQAWARKAVWLFAGAALLSGCSIARWSGYSKPRRQEPTAGLAPSREAIGDPSFSMDELSADGSVLSRYPRTPAEHRAAARHYREKAAEARRLAERHQRMKELYRQLPHSMAKHCDRVSKRYEELAEEFDRFAAWHDEEASR